MSVDTEMKDTKRDQLEDIRSHLTNAITETMELYGVTPSIGRIYSTMYFHGDPITLDELHEQLGMSKGNISNGVRKLIQYKYVRRVFRRGERKDLFQAETDLHQNFISLVTRRWERELDINLAAIRKIKPKYKQLINDPTTPEVIKNTAQGDLAKIKQSTNYYYFLEKLIKKTETGELFHLINNDNDNGEE